MPKSQVKYKAEIPQQEQRNQVLLKAWDFCFDCWKHSSACVCNTSGLITEKYFD